MRMLLAFVVAIGLLTNDVGAGQCDRFQFYDGSRVMSPGYHAEKDKYTCSAYLPFRGSRGGIHLIQMIDIQLYVTTYNNRDRCSLSFQFGAYSWPCQRTVDDCIVYYNRDSCLPYIRDRYPTCKRFKTSSSGIYAQVRCWAINAYVSWEFGYRYPKGLKLDYNYITCPEETTTTRATTTTTTRATTTTTTTTEEATTATIDDPENWITDHVHIIVPSAVSLFVLLMIALIVAVLVQRRKRRKNNRSERPRTSVSSSTQPYEYMTVVTPESHGTECIEMIPTYPPPLPPTRLTGIAAEDSDMYLQPITRKAEDDDSDDGVKMYENCSSAKMRRCDKM